MTTPAELLAAARDLPTRADPKTAGLWPHLGPGSGYAPQTAEIVSTSKPAVG